ncbi:MAG: amylo-alpha-1,6-glucosidase [Chloroflexia bacterium]
MDELPPTLREIVAWHRQGTRATGSASNPGDGLLRAGEPGVQLTWMDALVDGWVVTPRTGKPVEINTLWYNALRMVAAVAGGARGWRGAEQCDALAEPGAGVIPSAVCAAGWARAGGCGGWRGRWRSLGAAEPDLRRVAAIALLEGAEAGGCGGGRADAADGYGLRTLGQEDRYHGDYGGDRNGVMGRTTRAGLALAIRAYAEAYARVYGNRETALTILRPFEQHLADACIGSISERSGDRRTSRAARWRGRGGGGGSAAGVAEADGRRG